jgi:hypothetical protein
VEELYYILTEFGTSMKLFRPIQINLHGNYSKVWIEENFSDVVPIQTVLKVRDALLSLPCDSAFWYNIMEDQENLDSLKLVFTDNNIISFRKNRAM